MIDYNKLIEINSTGEDRAEHKETNGNEEELYTFEIKDTETEKHISLLAVQVIVCAILVIGLFVVKNFDQERFVAFSDWYNNEMKTEIELPSLMNGAEENSSSEGDEASSEAEPLENNPTTVSI